MPENAIQVLIHHNSCAKWHFDFEVSCDENNTCIQNLEYGAHITSLNIKLSFCYGCSTKLWLYICFLWPNIGIFLIFNREDLFKMLTLFQCHSWTRQPKNKDIALFFHTNLYNLIER